MTDHYLCMLVLCCIMSARSTMSLSVKKNKEIPFLTIEIFNQPHNQIGIYMTDSNEVEGKKSESYIYLFGCVATG